ncbi:ABC transporter permease [Alicyclobacillus cycloheptanicus]|uniref:Peptide/nickel transport system permease protein n=1 Tax=Alicyclobacillus cycloheptanicus TaxID=1457 RepID=A0ABT9XHW6_9BACL|nr:ABC transporter permease [Alicyclobacillus cycloheptanicus]MDQ0189883.1 peptide/nickel transport system permease protein [Alicyclobacillus cycloheptanicus]WDM02212.1 ABC transporter permease [Alicyclobacillus cycloheptanicus]
MTDGPKAALSNRLKRSRTVRLRGIIRVLPFSIIILLFVVISLFPSLFAAHNPNTTNLMESMKPPFSHMGGSTYVLGTDELGRDVYARLIYGARVSLLVSSVAVCISGIVGGFLGMMAGFFQKVFGTIIMRFADMVLSVPFFLLAVLTVAVLGPSLMNLIVVLGLTRWPRYARVAYAQTLSTVNQDFVRSSEALGATSWRLLVQQILPEVIPPLIVVATLEIGLMIVFEASLSFLGLGVQPPNPSWGSMLTEGQQYINSAWWLATFPGIAIFIVVLSVNLVGDYVRDRLDPKAVK